VTVRPDNVRYGGFGTTQLFAKTEMLLPKPSNQRRSETWPLVAGVFVLCAVVALSVKALKVGTALVLFSLWMLKGNFDDKGNYTILRNPPIMLTACSLRTNFLIFSGVACI
jgi:hypothetical protein